MSQELAAPTKQQSLLALLSDRLPDVRNVLPPGTIKAEALEVAFRNAFNKNPKLMQCSAMSICNSLVNAATLGLIPGTPEQHAYLIPRKSNDVLECNLEIGYRGFVHMILRGGKVSHVDSGVVRKGDEYEFQKGDPVVCLVRPNLDTENRNSQPIIAAYCLIVFKDVGKRLEVMDGSDLAKIERAMMRQNFNKATPAWKEWPDEMMRKAPIKRIAKTCDLGPLVARAAEMDNIAFAKLPSCDPKPITLPDGATVEVLPRHEQRTIEDAEPESQEPEFGTKEGAEAPELF